MGTPDFISPEQAKDARSADIRSDIYSLGSTLYFLLSGRPPFHEGSVMTRLKGHASETPAALETLRDDLPEQLIATVARMTAKNPSERFQTPAEVAEALAPFLRPEPRQPNSSAKSVSMMHVSRYLAGALTLAIAAMLVVQKWKEPVADKLAMMKAPVAVLSEPPEGTARALLYTVEADALDGHPAAICDIGNCRIAIVDQDVSQTRDASESINLVVTGPTSKRQSAVDSSQARYFTSIYADGEARCRFHGFNFTLTEKMIRFGTTATFWGKDRSPGQLIMVDVETGEVITQPMKPAVERVLLAGASRELTTTKPATSFQSQPVPVTAELKIANHSRGPNTKEEFHYGWNLSGRSIGAFDLRLLVLRDGEVEVVQQYDCTGPADSCAGEVLLKVEKKVDGAGHIFSAELQDRTFGLPDRMSRVRHVLPLKIDLPDDDMGVSKLNGSLKPGKKNILYSNCYSKGALKYERTYEAMLEATRSGAVFVLVTLDWKPITKPEVSQPASASGTENDAQSQPEFDGLDQKFFGSAREKEMFKWLAKTDPATVQRVAEKYVAQGQDDAAARVLALDTPPAPEALAALQLARIQLNEGKLEKAADNYLKAYLIAPATMNVDHLTTIIQAQRLEEFVNVLTEDRLRKLGYDNDAEKIVLRLLKEESTRDHGYQFLSRLWKAQPQVRSGLLNSRHNEIWANVPDSDYYLRATLLPSDIAAEGPGWERFTVESIDARGGKGYGVPMNLDPLLFDKTVLRNLARDVESAIDKHPAWKAGHLVLAFLEAELGNETRSAELLEQALADSANPIPPQSAWVFGQALEGKGDELDRWVTRLYEINVTGARDPASPLRETAIGSLARLYDRSGYYGKARKLLRRLAEPEGPSVVCAWSRSNTKETCAQCHKHERGLENYILMANALTDIDFPVDARIALARIGSSFSNAYGSDMEWAKVNTPVPDWEYQGKEAFQPARAKAEQAITPEAVVEAFDRGVFEKPLPAASQLVLDDNPPDFPRLDLMIGIRGERGRSTLFSPVIDILAKAAGHEDSNRELDRLDQKLTHVPPGHRKSLDEMIAVTVLSFARNRLPEAKLRAEQTLAYVKTRDVKPVDIGLLFIARRALKFQSTKAIGEELADRARKAAALIDRVPSEALK